MIMRAIALTMVGCGFLVAFVVAGILGAFVADRSPPITVILSEIITPVVAPGGDLRLRFTLARARSCATHVDRVMRDSAGNREILDDVDLRASPGALGTDTFITSIKVPLTFVPGPALYVATTQYRCNLVHELWPITVPPREIGFTVGP